jgi:hypothetical protein
MIFEYMRLTGMEGGAFSVEFATRAALLVLAGIMLLFLGFKIKGAWGAAIALMLGGVFFLYNEGIIGIEPVMSFFR